MTVKYKEDRRIYKRIKKWGSTEWYCIACDINLKTWCKNSHLKTKKHKTNQNLLNSNNLEYINNKNHNELFNKLKNYITNDESLSDEKRNSLNNLLDILKEYYLEKYYKNKVEEDINDLFDEID